MVVGNVWADAVVEVAAAMHVLVLVVVPSTVRCGGSVRRSGYVIIGSMSVVGRVEEVQSTLRSKGRSTSC